MRAYSTRAVVLAAGVAAVTWASSPAVAQSVVAPQPTQGLVLQGEQFVGEVIEQIQRLRNPDGAVRRQAADRLVFIGEAALPLLLENERDPVIGKQVREIIARIRAGEGGSGTGLGGRDRTLGERWREFYNRYDTEVNVTLIALLVMAILTVIGLIWRAIRRRLAEAARRAITAPTLPELIDATDELTARVDAEDLHPYELGEAFAGRSGPVALVPDMAKTKFVWTDVGTRHCVLMISPPRPINRNPMEFNELDPIPIYMHSNGERLYPPDSPAYLHVRIHVEERIGQMFEAKQWTVVVRWSDRVMAIKQPMAEVGSAE